MRVLMAIRPDYLTVAGGDSVQLLRTREALLRAGVAVEVMTEMPDSLREFDLIHCFNLTRPHDALRHAWRAQAADRPVALSTIYWEMDDLWLRGNPFRPAERALQPPWDAMSRAHLALLQAQAQTVVTMSDWFLPNSRAEGQLVTERLGAPADQQTVAVLGVDPIFFSGDAARFEAAHGLRDFVLCVGRLDHRKNQEALLHALRETQLPLVLIGDAADAAYAARCRAAAAEGVRFLPAMEPAQLADAYAAARVHALPSWYETPGLVNLEAAAAGCALVTTDRGSAREYFGDTAHYCDPRDPASIRAAVRAAWEAPPDPSLAELVRTRYTWDAAAEQTRVGYERAIAAHPADPVASAGAWVARGGALLAVDDAWLHYHDAERTYLQGYLEFLRAVPERLQAEIAARGEQVQALLRRVDELHADMKEREAFIAKVQGSPAYRALQALRRLTGGGRH